MNHPEILLLPVLMLADYWLTLAGATLAERKYRKHFRIMSYELNPLWRGSVSRRKWFNPRHHALVAVITGGFIAIAESGQTPEKMWPFLLGALLSMFASVVGRHISNLFIFRYVDRHPDSLSGTVDLSQRLIIKLSQYQMTATLVPLVLVAIFTRADFAAGAALGIVVAMAVHSIWHVREGRSRAPAEAPKEDGSAIL